MDSFIFNSFKNDIINGNAKKEDTWYFYPVKKSFTADCEYLRYAESLTDITKLTSSFSFPTFNSYITDMKTITYIYSRMTDTDDADEPQFVTQDNFTEFVSGLTLDDPRRYDYLSALFFTSSTNTADEIGKFARIDHFEDVYATNGTISKTIPVYKGFYYVRTVEELKWCANRVNGVVGSERTTKYDNTINIVLGDNIGLNVTSALSANKKITTHIGEYDDRHFEGVFFGNGYKFTNVTIECNNNNNGIFGTIGISGIVDSFRVDGKNMLLATKRLDISHLKLDSSDINAGFICGKNYGAISNVEMSGTIYVSGFVPAMYSMSNKTTDNGVAFGNPLENMFYPDYLCFNSPGNIIPYIGYFNEGVFATLSGRRAEFDVWGNTKFIDQSFWNYYNIDFVPYTTEDYTTDDGYASATLYAVKTTEDKTKYLPSPAYWYYQTTYTDKDTGAHILHATRYENRANILFFDSNITPSTIRLQDNTDIGFLGTIGFVPNVNNFNIPYNKPWYELDANTAGLFNDTLALNIENSLMLAGNNFSYIKYATWLDKSIKMNIQNRAAYCVSPVAGNNAGTMQNMNINTIMKTNDTFVGFAGGVAGKQADGAILNCVCNFKFNDDNTRSFYRNDSEAATKIPPRIYAFAKRSIKNVGGLFGSYIIGPTIAGLQLINVSASLNTDTVIRFNNDNSDYPGLLYNELSANQLDYYFANRFGGMAAIAEFHTSNCQDIWIQTNEGNTLNDPAYKLAIFSGCAFKYIENNYSETSDYVQLGTFAAKYDLSKAEKYGGSNYSFGVASPFIAEIKPVYNSTPSIISTMYSNITSAGAYCRSNFEQITTKGNWTAQSPYSGDVNVSSRVGLFTVDQNFASPLTDPLFYCINCECDLPGIGNRGITNNGNYNILDRNIIEGENFALDIKKIPSKIFAFSETDIYCKLLDNGSLFSTVTVPRAANIKANNDDVAFKDNEHIPDGNKYPTTYPYFGSDISLYPASAEEPVCELATFDYDKLKALEAEVGGTARGEMYDKPMVLNAFTVPTYMGSTCIIETLCEQYPNGTGINEDAENIFRMWRFKVIPEISDTIYADYVGENKYPWTKWYNFSEDKAVRIEENDSLRYYIGMHLKDHDDNYNLAPPNNMFMCTLIEAYVSAGDDTSHEVTSGDYVEMHNWFGDSKNGSNRYNKMTTVILDTYHMEESRLCVLADLKNTVPFNDLLFDLNRCSYGIDDYGRLCICTYGDKLDPYIYKTGKLNEQYQAVARARLLSDGVSSKYHGTVPGVATDGYFTSPINQYTVIIDPRANASEQIQNPYIGQLEFVADGLGSDDNMDKDAYAVELNNKRRSLMTSFEARNNNRSTNREPGRFYNDLLRCTNVDLPGIRYKGDSVADFPIIKSYLNSEPIKTSKYYGIWLNKLESDAAVETDDSKVTDYFKYTYVKSNPVDMSILSMPVKFDIVKNDDDKLKAGYWFKYNERIDRRTKSMRQVQEYYLEHNDNLTYNGSVLHFGKTLNEANILNKDHLNSKTITACGVSSISADDFEGILVMTDGKTSDEMKPVMYINVGLGECPEGTSWALECEKAKGDNKDASYSGLLLEV